MEIVHIMPSAPYNEGWGYQDNILPKYHALLGNNVTIITTDLEQKDGKLIQVNTSEYKSKDGFKVIRKNIVRKLGIPYISVYSELECIKPDYVFFHGLVSATIFEVTRYKKTVNPNLIIVQDNHLDYNIGYNPGINFKNNIRCFMYRIMFQINEKYIDKVYGVTPWRKQYAEQVFKVPYEKTDVLIMGADDQHLDFKNSKEIRNNIRKQYEIEDDEFLILSGGKIDKKKKIEILMQACSNMENVKLLLFGTVSEECKNEFDRILEQSDNIIYIGWIESASYYNYCFASDLVFFPGQHSVLWEQACASKIPCVFSKWPGMDHVDIGGNCDFIEVVDEKSIIEEINSLLFTEKYQMMKEVAQSSLTDVFLYSKIAEKSINDLFGEKNESIMGM